MISQNIEKKFEQIGARIKIFPQRRLVQDISVNILKDSKGEYFDVLVKNPEEIDLQVLDLKKQDKHLLLMAKTKTKEKMKFLCGYDERHFFSCAIPETAGVSTVFQAKQALKPQELISTEINGKIKTKDIHKRHKKIKTGKIHRQGEFFFVPMPFSFSPDSSIIHKNEPMSRSSGSKSHVAECLSRSGGTKVYVSRQYPNGISETEYQKLIKDKAYNTKNYSWTIRVRNPKVYVKGRISHSDHKTLDLGNIWHRVIINTEGLAKASRNVTFLD